MKTSREFSRWFSEQYGNRPSNQSWQSLHNAVVEADAKYHSVRGIFTEVDSWDVRYQIALTAWKASKGKKKARTK